MLEIIGDVTAAMHVPGSFLGEAPPKLWNGAAKKCQSPRSPPSSVLIRVVLWKIYEIGWRYELCALDQPLNPQL